jgi:hypothetical protein
MALRMTPSRLEPVLFSPPKASPDAASQGGAPRPGLLANPVTVRDGDHKLTFRADALARVIVSNNHGVVDIPGRYLDVDFENGRVVRNDAEYAKRPAGTKDVAIAFLNGKLSVKADGKEVPEAGDRK